LGKNKHALKESLLNRNLNSDLLCSLTLHEEAPRLKQLMVLVGQVVRFAVLVGWKACGRRGLLFHVQSASRVAFGRSRCIPPAV